MDRAIPGEIAIEVGLEELSGHNQQAHEVICILHAARPTLCRLPTDASVASLTYFLCFPLRDPTRYYSSAILLKPRKV